ncbi:ethylene-responsive transcription factor 4-like [Lycium ferocissimum]|uniref:ethylene-responsive transcription factor 4-like n=1 Tax=Lycium ferocissimum TaxID=112874 RepID=UPI002814BF89|nr:ethylene-responsive transcription factor 4-like [Lycium ferocissimum]
MAQKENSDATVTFPPHQMRYSGVRKISRGKYIAEIRDPDQKRRVWLETFDTLEKATRFYDLVMWLLRGLMLINNFTQTTEEYLQYANRGGANDGSGSGVKSQAEPLNLELSLAPKEMKKI